MHRIHFSLSDTGTSGDTGYLPSGKLQAVRLTGDTGSVSLTVYPNRANTNGSYSVLGSQLVETTAQQFWPRGRDTGSAQDAPYVFANGERLHCQKAAVGAATTTGSIDVWVYIDAEE